MISLLSLSIGGLILICELLFPGLQYKPVPLIEVFIDGRSRLVITGYFDVDYLKGLFVRLPGSGLLVVSSEERVVTDEGLIAKLSELFTNPEGMFGEVEERALVEVLPVVVSYALVNSINSCTFLVFIVLLLIASHLVGRRRMGLISATFILAVYFTYLLIGLNLVRIVGTYSVVGYAIASLGLLLGFITVLNALRKGEGCSA